MLPSSSFCIRQIFTDETGNFHLAMEKIVAALLHGSLLQLLTNSLGEDASIHAFCRTWFMFTAVADP